MTELIILVILLQRIIWAIFFNYVHVVSTRQGNKDTI